jgi:hypothetical protein
MADKEWADGIWEQLHALQAQKSTTGMLVSAQVLQLHMWKRLALPHAKKVTLAWDKKNRIVEFRPQFGTEPAPKDLAKRLRGLDRSVKDMLGKDVEVRVKTKDSVLFRSAGKKEKKGVRRN